MKALQLFLLTVLIGQVESLEFVHVQMHHFGSTLLTEAVFSCQFLHGHFPCAL